ncbi:MAG: type I restriction endonuclease subunit R [Candidatus Methanoplasma sp.]|jgi:type I restriction enzyme R subunit|nr:type I restriction endonuclease subunit R [Candidatus Methanoplasma sp.]
MSSYNIIASTDEETVVSEYVPDRDRSHEYQSEAALEKEFIETLCQQGYEYIDIKNEADLILNLRYQLERLNSYQFSDKEWGRFFSEHIANANEGIVEKTRKMQIDHVRVLKCDDGHSTNISLINKKNIHANCLQIINQYEAEGARINRYDVTILVNGLPLIHIELKRRGVAIREAFNQVKRYERDSFWSGSGLFDYIQVFVISNGVHTKYYSNTTREQHIRETDITRRTKKTSNSFEFTSWWADAANKAIPDLVDFTKTFFAKHTVLSVLTKYCVFTAEDMLLVMRPYQIAATERILQRIQMSDNYRTMGSAEAGGYVWHTTGSGKTLTSFKTAQLARGLDFIDKVLFVVDRKDLDYQTMREYDRFEKGAANGNADTKILQKQLEDNSLNSKIIITTIQKLSVFVKKNRSHCVYDKHVVMIFDECHRSQFGDMHAAIIKKFKRYHIFGFTGTPIFAANAGGGKNPVLKTTEQAFGQKLHSYTIVDAINDGNVLPFRIDYVDTVRESDRIFDTQVRAIDRETALCAPERVKKISEYILKHFSQKTKRNNYYNLGDRRLSGFNSILATASIDAAKRYYAELKKQNEISGNELKIALIYSFAPNDDSDTLPDEDPNASGLDRSSRDFLDSAIVDYNVTFKTNFDSSGDKFGNYYKDLSRRVREREIDLLIVVNMFLTGFDATTLNTLWVDKNLKQHGLIQAFSRTNRILNSVKTYGNIVCFRGLEQAVDDAIALFGNKDAGGIVLLKPYKDYYIEYEKKICELEERFSEPILGEMNEKNFIKLFGAILRLKNILSSFDEFADEEILSPRDFQEFQSVYIDLYQDYSGKKVDKENIIGELIFEVELIKQTEVNIDYILMLVEKYRGSGCEDKVIKEDISKAILSSIKLRSKKELIEEFIASVNTDTNVDAEWERFVHIRKEKDLERIVIEEGLKAEETQTFIGRAFRDGMLRTNGMDFNKIMLPISMFSKESRRGEKKAIITEKLMEFFERYVGLS